MGGVGVGTGFVFFETDGVTLASESVPTSSSICRCLALSILGSADGEPVSSFLDSSLFNRRVLSNSVLDLGDVSSGTEGVSSEVGLSNTSVRWRRTMLQ